MKNFLTGAALISLFASGAAMAGNTDVFVFLEDKPLQGVSVLLNGNPIGKTNAKGETSTVIEGSGKQILALQKDGEELASSEFAIDTDQSTEVSVVLSTSEAPKISIFQSGDDASSAMGFLTGQIQDAQGNPLSNAYIAIKNTEKSAVTDESGQFDIELPRGIYEVEIAHQDHQEKRLSDIRIIANIGTAAVVKMQALASASGFSPEIRAPLEEVLILGYLNTSKDSAFTLEQMSTAVVDAIDIDQIVRFGDSNVASTLKRVVGVSIVDGKYAVVRGLDGRYISATLNNNLMPTTNAFKRDAELDLFPSDILGGIEIQKSYSADLPADSTAGIIAIKTKDMPQEGINKLSLSVGYNTDVTGEDFLTYQGGSKDSWGRDDGTRELPAEVYAATNGGLSFSVCQFNGQTNCATPEEAANLAIQLDDVWATKTSSAKPDTGISWALGGLTSLELGTLSALGSLSFDRAYQAKTDGVLNSAFEKEGNFSESAISTSLNGYFVTGLELNNGSKLQSKTMLLKNTDDTTRFSEGIDNSDDSQFASTTLEWKEREFFGQQFSGEHTLPKQQILAWGLGISKTTQDIPDRRSYTYLGDFLAFTTVERMWAELIEDGNDARIDYTLPLDFSSSWRSDFKLGVLYNQKDRDNEIVRLGVGRPRISLDGDIESLLSEQTFLDDNLRLRTITTDTDRYQAEQDTKAIYFSSETHFNETWTFVTGVRQEDFSQEILLPNFTTGETEVSKETDDIYPSLSAIYRPSSSWQIRLGASQTISRPTLTEVSPAEFYDDQGKRFKGNPELLPSDITNLDLRVDYYFGSNGNISLAFFNKDIKDPVEVGVLDGSGSAVSGYTWRNEEKAELNGVEFDIAADIVQTDKHSVFIGANVTVINSDVTLSDVSARLQLDTERDLQGQSPLLGNLQLGYDHFPSGQKVTFLVNYFDDRIDVVTRSPQSLIYEKGRMTVDANYEVPFFNDKASFAVKVKNLSNEKEEYLQNENVIEGWKNGSKISFDFSYKF